MAEREKKTILIAERGSALKGKLTGELDGYRILTAGSMVEAVELIEEAASPVDLLIADKALPPFDGLWIIDALSHSHRNRDLPVLILCRASEVASVGAELTGKPQATVASADSTAGALACLVEELIYGSMEDRSSRVKLSMPARLTCAEKTGSVNIRNISEGGAYLYTFRRLAAGSEVRLSFTLPGSDATTAVAGRIRRRRSFGDSYDLMSGLGIEFTETTRSLKKSIADLRRKGKKVRAGRA